MAGDAGDVITAALFGYGFDVRREDASNAFDTGNDALDAKIKAINQRHRDEGVKVAVEVHFDSAPSATYWGPRCFIWKDNPRTRRLARYVTDELCRVRNAVPRAPVTYPDRNYPRDGFCRYTACDALLVELGNINSPKDAQWLGAEHTPTEAGIAIARGIIRWLKETRDDALRSVSL